ncbi:hypothetical protein ZWY2020_042434 [Hordeum vulgare]|nr:hypothetical protein ZWY2020_042434 [Hordeum vulgare]
MDSPDPRQRDRWYEYHSRISLPDREAKGPVNLRIIEDFDNEEKEEADEEEDVGEADDSDDDEEEDYDKEEEEDAEDDSYHGVWRSYPKRRLHMRWYMRGGGGMEITGHPSSTGMNLIIQLDDEDELMDDQELLEDVPLVSLDSTMGCKNVPILVEAYELLAHFEQNAQRSNRRLACHLKHLHPPSR